MSLHSVHATPAETRRRLPGDDLIARPIASLTHAITIRCPPDQVWPWLAQMGAGRAGWYSYDFIDNGRKSSAERIIPELQRVEVGFIFPWLPRATQGFIVLACDPGRSLVLGTPAPAGTPVVTWAFVLEPLPDGNTRLLVRARASTSYEFHGLPTWVVKQIVPPGHFVMQRKQLLGIARRAERATHARPGRWIRRATGAGAAALGMAMAGYAAFAAYTWYRYGNPPRVARDGDRDLVLDRFMPTYEIAERHQGRVQAPAELTLAAAREQDLQGSSVVRAIFKTREVVLGSTPDDRPRSKALIPELLSIGWGVLAEIPGREIVVGAVTQPWESNVVFRAVPSADFAAFHEPDHVKIVVSLRADPIGANDSVFRTETRAIATDAAARAKFRRYWAFVSPGVALIRRLSLGPLKADAERRAREARSEASEAAVAGVR
jgi:hypothetical protein